jgi:AraC-like DNA-binding protein
MYINRSLKESNSARQSVQVEIHSIASVIQKEGAGCCFEVSKAVYMIFWLQQGAGEISIDLEHFDLHENTIYYIKPGQALHAQIDESAKGYLITFAKEFLELYEKKASELSNTALFNHFRTTPVIRINSETNSLIANIAASMQQEFENYYNLRAEILKGFLKIFMIYLSRQFENSYQATFNTRKLELVHGFYTLLEKEFAVKKMVRDYAEVLAVTPSYLNDTVKEISGFTASYHIQQRIVLEAKRRAIFEGDSMKEIAYYLGFCDPAHFSKYFKNSSGTNFTDFKKGAFSYC